LGGDDRGKGLRRWIGCKKCVHIYVNAKMIPVKYFRNWGGVKDNGRRGWIQV
jgi:hypothetical protein